MNIQIFGTKKSLDTRKAERVFKERQDFITDRGWKIQKRGVK